MKNINLGILFNIINPKNSHSSNLELIHDKSSINSLFKNLQYVPSSKYFKQSLTKVHRPLTTKTKFHSQNKNNDNTNYNNHKKNEFINPIPIIYNSCKINDRNKLNKSNIKENDYNINLLNNTKINLFQKINGKYEEELFKNIISLPQIKEENNMVKKSIAIINQSKEKMNNVNLLKNINNIKVINNSAKKTGIFTKKSRYDLEEDQNKKNENINSNKINDLNKNISSFHRYNNFENNNDNIIFLKPSSNKIKNVNNLLFQSYQPSLRSINEIKKNKISNFNEIRVEEEYRGITNLIITNQKMIPEKNYIINNKNFLNDSYDNFNNIKAHWDKIDNNNNNNQIISKYNSYEKIPKEREIIKYPNLNCLYYSILPGNASYLIERCMKHRINWIKPFSVVSTLFNFKWQELSYGIDYCSLGCFPNIKQLVNHFENHFVISNKAKMFTNLLHYCEKRNLSAFKYVPFTIIFNLRDDIETDKENKKILTNKINKYEKLKEILTSIEKYLINYEDIGSYYQNESYKKYINYKKSKERRSDFKNLNYSDYKKLSKRANKLLRKNKKRNTASYNKKKETETNKENLNSDFTLYSDYFNNLLEENNVPLYDKNKELKVEEEKAKVGNKLLMNNEDKNIVGSNTCIEIPKTHYSGKNMWIVKAINLNRGMCIRIVNSYEQMIKIINKFKEGVDYTNFTKEKIEENNELITETNLKNKSLNKSSSKLIKSINNLNIRKKLNSANKTKTILINKEIIKNQNKEKLLNKNNLNSVDKPNKSKTIIDDKNEDSKVKIEEKNKIKEMKEKEKLYNCNRIIIQKYIENPLLYKGRKFDMRIWVLLTHTMKVYVFKEGHLKTCSIEYNLNSKDAFAHITNYSFQKYNTNFQKYEKGNEVPFFEFQQYLKDNYPDKNYDIQKNLIQQIKEIIKVTMRSVKYKINKNRRNYQFEIFGYDFMMDTDFNLFLIEINTNPGLEESSPWIKIIVPRMLDDALRLTIDQLFETKYDFDVIKKNRAKEEIINYNNILNIYNKINTKYQDEYYNNESYFEYKNDNNNNSDIHESSEKINRKKNKNIDKDTKKYISPFPVPGYSLNENIWDFVCDLDDTEPLDENPNMDENIIKDNEKNYIGHKSNNKKQKKRKIKNMKNKNKKEEEEEDEETKNSS